MIFEIYINHKKNISGLNYLNLGSGRDWRLYIISMLPLIQIKYYIGENRGLYHFPPPYLFNSLPHFKDVKCSPLYIRHGLHEVDIYGVESVSARRLQSPAVYILCNAVYLPSYRPDNLLSTSNFFIFRLSYILSILCQVSLALHLLYGPYMSTLCIVYTNIENQTWIKRAT